MQSSSGIFEIANQGVTLDWQFGIAYNAALKLATILVRASGHRVKGNGHHMNTILLIPEILGKDKGDDADYLDTCRRKRNAVEYDCVGGATEDDVKELREFVSASLKNWLLNGSPKITLTFLDNKHLHK